MRSILNILCFVTALLITMAATYALASDTMQTCTLADGSVLYTNKDVKGCTILKLPALSVVPDRDYHGSITPKITIVPALNSVHPNSIINDRLCSLYNEWMIINEKTQGGMIFAGVDQKIRYNSLWRTFSSGFIAVDCKTD